MAPPKAAAAGKKAPPAPAPAAASSGGPSVLFALGRGLVLMVAATLVYVTSIMPRINLPDHLLGHQVIFDDALLSPEDGADLRALVKEMSVFPSNAADVSFYTARHEHVGEGRPFNGTDPNAKCDHPFLVPNTKRDLCVLPGRLDIARHFIMSGGVQGLKDDYAQMASRVQSFGRYIFDLEKYPAVERLFQKEKFLSMARAVCPPHQQYLDPFQFNFIMQIPGQSVAMHIDAPYFWGATRFQFPQWLLAAMVFSGMFEDKFVHQVQVVGYLHEWNDETRDGEFVYWDQNVPQYKKERPIPLAGSAVDGSKTVHAASVYQRGARAPIIEKSRKNVLTYTGQDERWVLTSDNDTVAEYTTDDLRVTIVYRARCFADAEEAAKFPVPEEETMQLDDILDTFHADLARRGRLSPDRASRPEPLDFALLILDEYIKYPLSPTARIPLNYCAASSLYPFLKPFLDLICNK